MERQTLRDWVHRYNAHGMDGLKDSWLKGHLPKLVAQSSRRRRRSSWRRAPTGMGQGVVRWRRIDLQRHIVEHFGVDDNEHTIGKILKQLDFTHISVRLRSTRLREGQTIAAFKKTLPRR